MWKKLGLTCSSLLILPFSPKPAGPGSPRGPIGPSRPLWPVGPSGPDSPVSKEVEHNQQCVLWYCSLFLKKQISQNIRRATSQQYLHFPLVPVVHPFLGDPSSQEDLDT